MSNGINLTKAELTEYLAKIDKAEDFKEWLTKKRFETQTLDSLLAPASDGNGKGTRKGGERGEVNYANEVIFL